MPTNTINARPFGYVNPACPVNWAHPLNAGRVSWWRRVSNPGWSGGLTLRDLVRGGHAPNDGTLSGTTKPAWRGPSGFPAGVGILNYNGSTAYVSCNGNITLPSQGTFAAWVNLIDISGNGIAGLIFSRGSGSNVTGMQINNVSGTNHLGLTWNNNSTTYNWNGGPTITKGVPYFMAVSVTPTGVTAFAATSTSAAGGISTATLSVTNTSAPLTAIDLGQDSAGSRFLQGYMDDATIFTRALTTAELIELYKLSRRGYPGVLNYIAPVTYFGVTAAAPAATDTYPAYRPNQTFCDRITEEIFVL